jgi:hypothetical protein
MCYVNSPIIAWTNVLCVMLQVRLLAPTREPQLAYAGHFLAARTILTQTFHSHEPLVIIR